MLNMASESLLSEQHQTAEGEMRALDVVTLPGQGSLSSAGWVQCTGERWPMVDVLALLASTRPAQLSWDPWDL
jgi:hypothetical protein